MPALRWTNMMSGFILRRFVDLVAEGVKTDKGFKEVHLNQVARALTDFCGIEGHVQAHPKDADFLNKPIEQYLPMQIIFGSGVATGRFAMGSSEPLGRPAESNEAVDVDPEETVDSPGIGKSPESAGTKTKSDAAVLGKSNRVAVMDDDLTGAMRGMTATVQDVSAAMRELAHCEAAPAVYEACMGCTGYGYSREALMCAIGFLMDNKAQGLVFVQMSDEDRDLWLSQFLAKHYHN
ncbi:hypothetical protein ACP70R_012207 [Stipagrostis hirtigluma subsp. patula]